VNRVASIFSQILQLFPRLEFEACVKNYKAERHARGFTCWGQLAAMLFCQLGRAHSDAASPAVPEKAPQSADARYESLLDGSDLWRTGRASHAPGSPGASSDSPGASFDSDMVKPVGKPDARNGRARFDERGWKTGRPPRGQHPCPSSTLPPKRGQLHSPTMPTATTTSRARVAAKVRDLVVPATGLAIRNRDFGTLTNRPRLRLCGPSESVNECTVPGFELERPFFRMGCKN
jgi:hypothetical protein